MHVESDTVIVAPFRRDDPEALFEEAKQHQRQRRIRLAFALALTAVVAAGAYGIFGRGVASSAGESPARGIPLVTASNPTVVLLVDVSGSMRANDIAPTRIVAVQRALRVLVARLPKRSKVGVVAFSANAEVFAQPTLDRNVVLGAIANLTPQAGTALGEGLAAAVKLAVTSLNHDGVQRASGHLLPADIVLASDGAQNRGALSPLQAANLARSAGIRVDAIALGTAQGKVSLAYGEYKQSIPVPPDPKAVALIARVTGGASFDAEAAGRLDSIYRTLGSSIGR